MSFLKKIKNIQTKESEQSKKEKEEQKKIKIKSRKKKKIKIDEISDSEFENSKTKKLDEKEKWFTPKGELVIDVFETESFLIVQSAIAGVKIKDLDIFIENDVLDIEGSREKPNQDEKSNYFYEECYWGSFYRRIILQEEVDNSRTEAIIKNGILTIKMPKIQRKKKRKIIIEKL